MMGFKHNSGLYLKKENQIFKTDLCLSIVWNLSNCVENFKMILVEK